METRTYNVYKFDELPEEAKQKALEKQWDINVDHEWWEYQYDDAENVGLKIEGFDTYRRTIEGRLTVSVDESVSAIFKDHGKDCSTYKLAEEYKDVNVDDDDYEEKEKAYEHALLEEYLDLLCQEYEYQTSEEQIAEALRANDYDFTLDGKID